MKKVIFTALCLFALLLCGCENNENENGEKEQEMNIDKTVNFVNEVSDADVWILPATKENLKTSLWGKATVPKTKTGESYAAQLLASEDGLYIFRMIDTDGYYYSADFIALEDGWTLRIKSDGAVPPVFTVEVEDGGGKLKKVYEVFAAML